MSPSHVDDHDMHAVQSLQSLQVPIIDLSLLQQSDPHNKSLVIKQIHEACLKLGCFQVVNHGISESVIEGALEVNSKFFNLPIAEKEEFISDDFHKPVRLSTVQGNSPTEGQFLKHFFKLYAHPLEDFVALWPRNPLNYREQMGAFTKEVRKLGIEVIGAIMESLKLDATYLRDNLEHGVQIMAANSYPPRSQSNARMGQLPHTDHSIISILLQSCPGLHVKAAAAGAGGAWTAVPVLKGSHSLVVLVGDHLQVLSNGLYKSVVHQVFPSTDEIRLSIASFHSLAMDEIVEPIPELVDEEHPRGYKGSNLNDFLNHLSSKGGKPFIETLRI